MKKTLATLTGAVAATIGLATAAAGVTATIGNDAVDRGRWDTYQNFTIADTNTPAPFDGTIEKVTFYAKFTGTVRFVVVDDQTRTVTYASDDIVVTTTGPQSAELSSVAGVTRGDYLGVWTQGRGVIPFDLTYDTGDVYDEALWTPNNSGEPVVNVTTLDEQTGFWATRIISMNAQVKASSPEICKNGGWESYGSYKNQGQCIASVVANENAGK